MTASKIEWCDRSDWNPVRGCTRTSPGCGGPNHQGGCYAEKIAARFSDPGQPFYGFAERDKFGGHWTGKVELLPDRLMAPLSWRRPAKIFALSMSDLFHEALPDADIDKVMAVMALAHWHTFQVLTKRSRRMRAYLSDPRRPHAIARAILDLFMDLGKLPKALAFSENWPVKSIGDIDDPDDVALHHWPLPNVYAGVSAEDQPRADERIPDLLNTPAAVRFVSAEPLLVPIDLTHYLCQSCNGARWEVDEGWAPEYPELWKGERRPREGLIPCAACNLAGWAVEVVPTMGPLHWVIAGGESGIDARPMHPDWARSLRDQCQATGVPFFFKQWGEWLPVHYGDDGEREYWEADDGGPDGRFARLRVRMLAAHGQHFAMVGKKRAGRLLDGVEWNGMPEVRRG